MQSSVEWLSGALNAAAEERATTAALQWWVSEQNATLHWVEGADGPSDSLVLPLCHLAEGFAYDWWRLFGGRDDGGLSIVRNRMGYAVPDVRLSFDGLHFLAEVKPHIYRNPLVRFTGGLKEELSRAEAEAWLTGFITDVVGQLSTQGVRHSATAMRWARVQASREDPDEAAFCEAAGALRVDPYTLEDSDARLISQAADLFKGEALIEFLGGVGRARATTTLDWIKEVDRRPAVESRVPGLKSLSAAVAAAEPPTEAEPGYALGYRRARAARHELNLKQNDRLTSMRVLADRLDAKYLVPAPPVDGLRALRTERRSMAHIHLRSQGDHDEARAGHNFAFARAVGDAACFPNEPGRHPINDLLDAYRQAAGRAFAAELLAPIDEIATMREDGRDVLTMATEFGVSSQVIERQMENEARIRAVAIA